MALRQVTAVLDALLDEFAKTGRESVSVTKAEDLAAVVLGAPVDETTVVLGAMQSEGVLNQELLYTNGGGTEQSLRIVFQALGEYMILRRRLAWSADPLSDDAVRAWLRDDCSLGLLEAAAVVLPELHAVELPDLLGIRNQQVQRPDTNDRNAHGRICGINILHCRSSVRCRTAGRRL